MRDLSHRLKQSSAGYGDIADVILLLSLGSVYRLASPLGLHLQNPEALRAACLRATREVADAYWHESAHGWVYDGTRIEAHFIETECAAIPEQDQNALCVWLENGRFGSLKPHPQRHLLFEALTWAGHAEVLPAHLHAEEYQFVMTFVREYEQAKLDPAYIDLREEVFETRGDEAEQFQKTKFHIILDPPDDTFDFYIKDWFLALEGPRDGDLMQRKLSPYVKNGPPSAALALEKTVQAYVETSMPSVADYLDGMRIDALFDWSGDA